MLKLSSCPDSIGELELFVRRLSEKYDICNERYPDILISLTEAVNNAIIHGNGENQKKVVVIDHDFDDQNCLTFTVSDEGSGFDFNNLPDPTSDEHIEDEGGRGVFLMKKLSDKLLFADNGSTVIIYFNL